MIPFRCLPIEADAARRLRSGATDDLGNAIARREGAVAGSPCRVCLREAEDGEALLLASYRLPRPVGLYWTPSPIFLHAHDCPRYARTNHIPDIVRPRQLSLRAYDADHRVIYDLGVVADGAEVEALLDRGLGDPRTAYVNIHTAKPGCLLCIAERIAA